MPMHAHHSLGDVTNVTYCAHGCNLVAERCFDPPISRAWVCPVHATLCSGISHTCTRVSDNRIESHGAQSATDGPLCYIEKFQNIYYTLLCVVP